MVKHEIEMQRILLYGLMSCIVSSFVILLRPTSRTKKVVHKATPTYDKWLQSTFKRVGVNTIPVVEEANIIILLFSFPTPKVLPHFHQIEISFRVRNWSLSV